MEPVPFFTLNDEFCRVGKIRCPGSVLPCLRDYVDHQIPRSRLTCLCQGASDCLPCFGRACEVRHGCGGRGDQPGYITSGQRGTTPRSVARRLLNNGLPCGESI